MTHRNVIRLSATLLAALALGCSNSDPVSADPASVLQVTPLFVGIDPGATQQLNATLGGQPAEVTWESSDPAVATVSPTGLVTGLTSGFTAITAKLVSDPSRLFSSNITVLQLLGTGLTNGVALTPVSSSGARFSTVIYRIFVPPGKTNLTVTFTGGTGDGDIYVARSVPPKVASNGAVTGATCASENGANAETCSISNPTSGTWYIVIAVWDAYANATLKATYSP